VKQKKIPIILKSVIAYATFTNASRYVRNTHVMYTHYIGHRE